MSSVARVSGATEMGRIHSTRLWNLNRSPGFDEVSEASMSDDPDFQRASSALRVLRQARLSRNKAAAIMVGDLVYQIANTGLRSPEQEEAREAAWVAISVLGMLSKKRDLLAPLSGKQRSARLRAG